MPVSKKLLENRKRFMELIQEKKLDETLKYYIENLHFSYSMCVQFLKRDHIDVCMDLTYTQLRCLLNTFQFSYDQKKYLKLPQEVKVQFQYSKEFSLDEIRKDVSKKSRVGAEMTAAKRRKWKHYNPKNTTEYWAKNSNVSNEKAERIAFEYRSKKSPYSKMFVKYENMSIEEKIERISMLGVERGIKGLQSMKSCVTKIEQMLYDELTLQDIHFSKQKVLRLYKTERFQWSKGLNKVFVYDAYLPISNTLIECNGTYWHADPRVYKSEQIIGYPGTNSQMMAREKWENDQLKINFAKSRGYNVLVLWELDFCKPLFLKEIIKSLC